MGEDRFLALFDIPGVKQYVFGTDPLVEIRGASALLSHLNRTVMKKELQEALVGATVDCVFAGGGAAQFLVVGTNLAALEDACRRVVRALRMETAGEVSPVFGCAAWPDGSDYPSVLDEAYFRLRVRREVPTTPRVLPTAPVMAECQSAAYLPGVAREREPEGEVVLLY